MVYRIANFGDGKINAFDINSGNFIAPLKNRRGEPLDFNGLWALFFDRVSALEKMLGTRGRYVWESWTQDDIQRQRTAQDAA